MIHYAGLDVSLGHPDVYVAGESCNVELEKMVSSDPDAIARWGS